MMQAVVIVFLTGLGIALLYALWRAINGLQARAEEVEKRAAEEPKAEPREIGEPLGPDGTAYLCAHRFVHDAAPRSPTNARRRAYAPLTGDELEPRRMAEQILYAVLVTLLQDEHIGLSIAETDPTFMPPFPHKRWILRAVRNRRLTGCPIAESLDCAFEVTEQKLAKKGGDVADGVPLDELIEEMLKAMRQEMSFWEKAGVYADIRQYLEAALIDQGYLIAPQKETWLDRLRHMRPTVNDSAVEYVESAAEALARRLEEFRMQNGSEAAATADSVPGGRTEDVDEALIEAQPPFTEMPLHDCMRVSIHEALLAIRQLEPSEDVGV